MSLPNRPRVTVLSIGAMGRAFVHRLLEQQIPVTVWNRTPGRAAALVERGASLAHRVDDAVEQGDIIIALPHPYDALQDYLVHDAVGERLRGKDLVVMSSCRSVHQPAQMLAWAQRHGAHLIDGKIFVYPREIGRPTSPLVYCGDPDAFARIRTTMSVLGKTLYLGERITHAAVMEASVVSWYLSMLGGFFNGLALCRSAGVPLERYREACIATLPGMRAYLDRALEQMIPQQDYEPEHHGTASMAGLACVLGHFAEIFEEHGIDPALVGPVASRMRQQVDAGRGGLDLAALIESFAGSPAGHPGVEAFPSRVSSFVG